MVGPSRRRTQEVLDATHAVLAPYLGDLMARSAAKAHCRDLGITGDFLTRQQVDALLERLGLGLMIFVGREKTAAALAAMGSAIDALGEVPCPAAPARSSLSSWCSRPPWRSSWGRSSVRRLPSTLASSAIPSCSGSAPWPRSPSWGSLS